MSERPSLFGKLFQKPKPEYAPFDIEEWKRQIKEPALAHPQSPPPAAEPLQIPTPRNSGEAYPSPLARILAPRKAARQKEQDR